MDAGHRLFVERGLDAVSLADILRISGGSLSTFYDLFESKEGLLAAIIGEYRAGGLAIMDSIIAEGGSPAATLSALATALHDEYACSTTIGLMRLAIAEGLRNPKFAHRMFECAHLPIVERLTGLFDQWSQEGRARIPDPYVAAELFLGLLIHNIQTRAFFGEPGCLPLLARDATIRDATALFVAGYQLEA